MDPITLAALTTAAGSVIGGGISAVGAHKANVANIHSAREQMAFQERMRGTQYQAAMDDMRKAGLNPILAAKVGGAGTPAGAMANVQSESGGLGESVGKASSSASEALRMKADIEKIKSDTILSNALASKAVSDARNTTDATAAQVRNTDANTQNVLQNIGIKAPTADMMDVVGNATSDVSRIVKGGPGILTSLGDIGRSISRGLADVVHGPKTHLALREVRDNRRK